MYCPLILMEEVKISEKIPLGAEISSSELITPLKINMEHSNGGLEDDCPFQLGDFQVPC